MSDLYQNCTLCPRQCHADRYKKPGFCQAGTELKVARAALHMWEEPCISGIHGSGTVFFSHCTLQCCFCQNHEISFGGKGAIITPEKLSEIFFRLEDQGAENINLVTPTHYLPGILKALDLAKPKLSIPVVYNCGGYERIETLKRLEGYVDIYLPDLKYMDSSLSKQFSAAENYFSYASAAVSEMIRQVGVKNMLTPPPGVLLKKGVILRHMILPGCRNDSIALLHWIHETLPPHTFLISLLSQYTPFHKACQIKQINRRITSFEYQKVVDTALQLGLTEGYMQERSSAKEEYTPPFNLEGTD